MDSDTCPGLEIWLIPATEKLNGYSYCVVNSTALCYQPQNNDGWPCRGGQKTEQADEITEGGSCLLVRAHA